MTGKTKRPAILGSLDERFKQIKRDSDVQKVARLIKIELLEHNKNNVRTLGFDVSDIRRWLRLDTENPLAKVEGDYLVIPESLLDIPDAPRQGTDPLFLKKEENYQALAQMAKALHQTGVDSLPPIDILQDPDNENKFIIHKGHRRHLSHIMALKPEAYCFVRNEKFSDENELRLFREAYAENRHHKKISLSDEIQALNKAVKLIKKHNPNYKENSDELKAKVREYLSMSAYDQSVLWSLRNCHHDVMTAISLNVIRSPRRAYELNRIEDPDDRMAKLLMEKGGEVLIKALNLDVSQDEMKSMRGKGGAAESEPNEKPEAGQGITTEREGSTLNASDVFPEKRIKSRKPEGLVVNAGSQAIPLGRVNDTAAKKILTILLQNEEFESIKDEILSGANLDSTKDLSIAWMKFIRYLALNTHSTAR